MTRRPLRCSLRVRSVIGMPGSPNTVSMPFSFSASITRLKPSVSSTGCGCGAAEAAGAVFCSCVAVTVSIPMSLLSDQARAARPLVFRAEHHHGRLGGVRVCGDAVVEQELRGFLHLHVAGQRGDDRLVDALGAH